MKSFIILILVFCTGCATVSTLDIISTDMENSLNACSGKATKQTILMQAGRPTHKEIINGREIWIYEYKKTEGYSTTTGTGSIFFPHETKQKWQDYQLRVSIGFNQAGVMHDWSYNGHITVFSNNPFRTLKCQ